MKSWTRKSGSSLASVFVLCCLLSGASGAWAGAGVVALQTADPSCADPTNPDRYIDCGNGTVTDNDTGLVWLADANCLEDTAVDWFTAMGFAAGLSDMPAESWLAQHDCGLSDGSSPGEWRLPSAEEWEAMHADAEDLGCSPTITNDAGNDCWDESCVTAGACTFSGVFPSIYWAANTRVFNPSTALLVTLLDGYVSFGTRTTNGYVWPVRGGQ